MATTRHSTLRKVLLQVATLAFVLNAVSAFGACCVTISQAKTMESTAPPCHVSDTQEKAAAEEDCCVICLPVITPPTADYATDESAPKVEIPTNIPVKYSGIDPPFRPPISLLV